MNQITKEKLDKYLGITKKALKMAANNINTSHKEQAGIILDMAQRYYDDALHYKKKGDFITSFAAVNYAHGWLDSGARLGFFDVHDSELFAAD